MSENRVQSGGIGFAGLLTILFIALKLTNHTNWSWAWVLSPLWVPLAVVLGLLVFLALPLWLYSERSKKKRRRLAAERRKALR